MLRLSSGGFVSVPENASRSEVSIFNIAYELGEKLLFDNPLGEPCEAKVSSDLR
jgi:hypothetical protein